MNKLFFHFFSNYTSMFIWEDADGKQCMKTDTCDIVRKFMQGVLFIIFIIALSCAFLYIPVVVIIQLAAWTTTSIFILTDSMIALSIVVLSVVTYAILLVLVTFLSKAKKKVKEPSVLRTVITAKLGKYCKPLTFKQT